MKRTVIATLLLAWFAATAEPAATANEMQLRDGLLKHFALDNLLPVFRPRGQEVGDVISANGAIHARRKDCFPRLQPAAPQNSEALQSMSLDLQAEGNFGIGLRRVFQFFSTAEAKTATRLRLTFENQRYVSVTTRELKKAFDRKSCPQLQDVIDEKAVDTSRFGNPLLVIQEVYYAKKRLSIDVDRSADAKLAASGLQAALKGASIDLDVKAAAGSQILVDSGQEVPVAVRIGFLPRPITHALLGGGGNPDITEYLWREADPRLQSSSRGFTIIEERVREATSGGSNPLLSDD